MECTLRNALQRIMGSEKSYLHYYRSIIKAYEQGFWPFDIKTLVKKGYIDLSCGYKFSKKGYRKRHCLVVLDFEKFKNQFNKYLNEYLYPMQEIRANKILARKAWVKKYGFISSGNQYCNQAMYDCSGCINKSACDIAKKYTGNEPAMKKLTKMLEILYGNIQNGHYAKQAPQ